MPPTRISTDKELFLLRNEALCILHQKKHPRALHVLCEKNYKFISGVAGIYYKAYRHDLEHSDLVQYAYIEYIRRIEAFIPIHGGRLNAYALGYIRNYLQLRIIKCGYTVHLPNWGLEGLRVILRETHRHPTLTVTEMQDLLESEKHPGKSVETLLNLFVNMAYPDSLDARLSPFGRESRYDITKNEEPTPEEIFCRNEICTIVKRLTYTLTPLQKELVDVRFGLTDKTGRTLKEIGQRRGISRERVRQILADALKKMRPRAEILLGLRSSLLDVVSDWPGPASRATSRFSE